ncbi:gas vesicle protein GvpG [Streptomyces sp. NBC_01387]|uniref:gas vesicle protein GvpG n=1 Tax=unclassified Streptomyces TaxID=2593676 RepID=UPI00202428CA|nr:MULTISPECIES: gas vesicle protein GvpG [unclassified Streptomyces]MCX4550820.1 gas vesicle protein GvpG [Streptomyces sp. NBC_01500]WSC22249.1 gas vesicle protein GvpG [Streptomyces sp. NBC_01766]WSV56098.1 gas vesicle protein GvpG [Streptomyces sp. NBC_01014]
MGLLSGVLLLPLAPVRGVIWVSDRLIDAAEAELYDPGVIRARLAALNRSLDEGEIDLPQFEREEERLLDLLDRKPLRPLGDIHGSPGTHV